MFQKIIQKLLNQKYITGFVIIIVIIISAQSYFAKHNTFEYDNYHYTHYNNYVIFKQSSLHLIHQLDLYQLFPDEHWDYYKYSPTFSLLFAPLTFLPDFPGLIVWNLLNALILLYALWLIPYEKSQNRLYAVGFILLELITSLQNEQSNGLIAGLIIFAFLLLERKQSGLATLLITLTVFIKLFGLPAFSLLLFYPQKIKSLLSAAGWVVILALLPLLVIPVTQLSFLYQSWFSLLQMDHDNSFGLSVMGVLYNCFNIQPSKEIITLAGILLFCVPLIKINSFKESTFRLWFLSSILIWVVIFNHKAESPTFIIAVCGIAIWYFTQKPKLINNLLFFLAFIFTVLSQTDLFPAYVRTVYLQPYAIKAVPCILIWMKILYDLISFKPENKVVKIHEK